ncbi:hypothetical protein EDB86DRAFT_2836977 [Lactarius hatsudake]|nr:hypothetical protein EDB86DRAFT_2836977 [Lactarius hatsudake]
MHSQNNLLWHVDSNVASTLGDRVKHGAAEKHGDIPVWKPKPEVAPSTRQGPQAPVSSLPQWSQSNCWENLKPRSGHRHTGMTPHQQYIVMDLWDQSARALLPLKDPHELIPSSPLWAVDMYPLGSVYHRTFLYHNEHVGRPYGYIFIIDHPTWTAITALNEAPVGIPQAEDIHAFIALNGDLAPHPAEYTDTITNRLFY